MDRIYKASIMCARHWAKQANTSEILVYYFIPHRVLYNLCKVQNY